MSPKNELLETAMREKIACHLPDAFEAAIKSYREFYDQPAPDDAKSFAAHHAACKAAIAHLQLLIKLANWVENDAAGIDADRLSETRQLAEEELSKCGDISQ